MDEALAPGTHLGPYEIEALIGSGGMGRVYRARDPRLGRHVAIKTLLASTVADAEVARRFETEARTVGSLDHPNLLVVYDVGRVDEVPYLVSELLEGETLRERLRRQGSLSERSAIDLTPVGWVHDGILITPGATSSSSTGEVRLVDPRTGRETPWANILPQDPAGIMVLVTFRVTPDSRSRAYTWHRALSDLYLADGLR